MRHNIQPEGVRAMKIKTQLKAGFVTAEIV